MRDILVPPRSGMHQIARPHRPPLKILISGKRSETDAVNGECVEPGRLLLQFPDFQLREFPTEKHILLCALGDAGRKRKRQRNDDKSGFHLISTIPAPRRAGILSLFDWHNNTTQPFASTPKFTVICEPKDYVIWNKLPPNFSATYRADRIDRRRSNFKETTCRFVPYLELHTTIPWHDNGKVPEFRACGTPGPRI